MYGYGYAAGAGSAITILIYLDMVMTCSSALKKVAIGWLLKGNHATARA
jgi:hypothetical protein